MKKNYKLTLITFLICGFNFLNAQFSGAFAPANWGTVQVNSDGITNASGAPASITMISGNNGSGLFGTNDYSIVITQAGQISFNWNYTTTDGPNYDYPQFVLNNVATIVNGFSTVGSTSQNGSQPCIVVNAGDVFRFRMYTTDNVFGAATCVFSNFAFTQPNLTITPASASVCPGQTVSFTASGGSNYSWSGGISNGVAFTPNASAIYTVTSGSGLCIVTRTAGLTYNPPLSITGPTANICANSSATLIGQGGTTYSWSTGVSSASSIVISPSVTTVYTITGVSSLGCNTSGARTVTVDPGLPVVTAASSSTNGGVCPSKTVTLTGGGATTYTWAGPVPVTNGVSFSPGTTPGTYTVTGGNSCGTATAAISVSIHPLPIVNASASTASLCSGTSLTLTASGNYANHSWAGGYNSGTGFFPTITATYVVTGTSALTCTASATVPVTVVTTPTLAPIASPALICVGQTATISATGATNYTWSPGNANTSSITVSPAQTTTYVITKSNANCVDTKTVLLTVNPLPGVFAIVTPTVICSLQTATLFGGGAQTFTWTAPNFIANNASPVVAPALPTTYTVVGSDGICTNSTTVVLAVDPNPTINVSASPTVICMNETTTLTANGAVGYTWTSSTGTLYTQTIVESPTVATLYSVAGANSFGCVSSAGQIILVNQLPPVTIVANKTLVCVGGDAKLTASGAGSYQWDSGAGGAVTATVNVNPQTTTSYTVEGTNTTTGCKNQKSITITVFEPSVSVSSPTSTCFGGLMNITANGATSYTWHLGGGVTIIFPTAQVSPTVFTIYTVTALTSTTGGLSCPSTNTTSIDIFYNPTITATAQRPSICKNESVKLFGNGGDFYSWTDPQSQNGGTITVTPQQQTTYTVTGTDSHGCVSTGTVMVKVSPCVGLNEFNADNFGVSIYPNPNDGKFTIQSEEFIVLNLSNELGQVIKTIELSSSHTKVSVDDLPKGIYFLSGNANGTKVNQKIIIIK